MSLWALNKLWLYQNPPVKKLTWITNTPPPLQGLWPRREGVEYVEGRPKATAEYSVEELESQGLIGAYVKMSLSEYRKLPKINSPKKT